MALRGTRLPRPAAWAEGRGEGAPRGKCPAGAGPAPASTAPRASGIGRRITTGPRTRTPACPATASRRAPTAAPVPRTRGSAPASPASSAASATAATTPSPRSPCWAAKVRVAAGACVCVYVCVCARVQRTLSSPPGPGGWWCWSPGHGSRPARSSPRGRSQWGRGLQGGAWPCRLRASSPLRPSDLQWVSQGVRSWHLVAADQVRAAGRGAVPQGIRG